MTVNDLTFGLELEVTLPAGTCQVGGYHCGRQIPQLPTGWNAQRDGSIRADAGFEGVEVVSPILKGADGLAQVVRTVAWLKEAGARVNRSTGLHVHVGFDRSDSQALARLVHLVSNYEKALFASTGTRSREQGHYCRTVRNDQSYVQHFTGGNSQVRIHDRYHVLNLTHPGTVEFRVFAGTTNVVKIVGYIRLCLALVQKALTTGKRTKWIGKKPVETSPLHRKGGEGQTELTRLFYGLGWTKGQAKETYGDLQAEGAPTIEVVKKLLMSLAKKYDGNTEDGEQGPVPAPAVPAPAAPAVDLARWEANLHRHHAVRVRLPDGTDCEGVFIRRYARTLVVQVSHLMQPIRVPRVNNRAHAANNGAFPV